MGERHSSSKKVISRSPRGGLQHRLLVAPRQLAADERQVRTTSASGCSRNTLRSASSFERRIVVDRVRLVVLRVRLALGSVEHHVGRDVDEAGANGGGSFRHRG